jgi:hypothetical protein
MNKKNILIIFCILLILLVIVILITSYSCKEGLDNSDAINIPTGGVIPDGYYKISDTKMKKIPDGYITNSEKNKLFPNRQTQRSFWVDYVKKKDNIMNEPILNSKKYNSDNYDLLYHDSEETIKYQSGLYGSDFGTTMVLDNCGNKILIPYSEVQGYPIYYKPGSYKYGASTYIPNYEDSVYFSRANSKNSTFFIPESALPSLPLSSLSASPLKYAKLPNKKKRNNKQNVVYLKPQFISLSTYTPNNAETIFSSKTSGIDTTSMYNCK